MKGLRSQKSHAMACRLNPSGTSALFPAWNGLSSGGGQWAVGGAGISRVAAELAGGGRRIWTIGLTFRLAHTIRQKVKPSIPSEDGEAHPRAILDDSHELP